MQGKCTIFFDDPFWVGVFERQSEDGYSVARYVFGAEPGQADILFFARFQYHLLVFSQPQALREVQAAPEGYKHRQHRIRHESIASGVGTRAQQAFKTAHELLAQSKVVRRSVGRLVSAEEKFRHDQEKKKQRKRGH